MFSLSLFLWLYTSPNLSSLQNSHSLSQLFTVLPGLNRRNSFLSQPYLMILTILGGGFWWWHISKFGSVAVSGVWVGWWMDWWWLLGQWWVAWSFDGWIGNGRWLNWSLVVGFSGWDWSSVVGFDDGTDRSLWWVSLSNRRGTVAGLAMSVYLFILFRSGWGSLLRWVCVDSGWVYCFGFLVGSWWFCGRF